MPYEFFLAEALRNNNNMKLFWLDFDSTIILRCSNSILCLSQLEQLWMVCLLIKDVHIIFYFLAKCYFFIAWYTYDALRYLPQSDETCMSLSVSDSFYSVVWSQP